MKASIIATALLTSFALLSHSAIGAEKPRTEASLECSKQADAKGLHGKERVKFRAKCKRDYKTSHAVSGTH